MEFSPQFLQNKLFLDQVMTFDLPAERNADGCPFKTGAFPQTDGSTAVRLYLPHAREVRLWVGASNTSQTEIALSPAQNAPAGVWEGVIPYDGRMTGSVNAALTVDGHYELSPDLPLIWTNNRPYNALELPEPEADYLMIQDVPHGAFSRNLFWSETMGNWENCYVYTPPGYMNSSDTYPVLYLLHGGGDNETCWEYVGRMSHIADNLLAAGKMVPCLIVMCNDMLRAGGQVSSQVDGAFEQMLLQDVIPYIEGNYRVRSGKWERAIAGLSMGAYMTADIAFHNPEVFGYVGTFTACLTQDAKTVYLYERPYPEFLAKGPQYFAECFRVFFCSTTPQENYPEFFAADGQLFAQAGIDKLPCYHRILYPERTTKWNSWRMGLRDYLPLLFR